MRARTQTAMVLLVGLVMSGFVAGCGGGKKGSPTEPTDNGPVVTNFQVRPLTSEQAGRRVEWLITATVVDPNNDLVGGRKEARIVATGQVIGAALDAEDLRGDMFAAVLFFENPPPGRIDLAFSIVDAAGHRSNEIPFSVNIAAALLPRGTVPGGFIAGFRGAR